MKTPVKKKAAKKVEEVSKSADRNLQVEYVPIDRLKPWDKNPRDNDDAAKQLSELIGAHGFIDPIIATHDGIIRAGHTRFKAAQLNGMAKVPVIFVEFDSEEDAVLYSISDNKASELARWNRDLLNDIFSDLTNQGMDKQKMASLSAFQEVELDGLRSVQDGYATRSFSEIAADFEQANPGAQKKEYWAWVIFRNEAEMKATIEAVGKTGRGGRELVTERLLDLLGISVPEPTKTPKVAKKKVAA